MSSGGDMTLNSVSPAFAPKNLVDEDYQPLPGTAIFTSGTTSVDWGVPPEAPPWVPSTQYYVPTLSIALPTVALPWIHAAVQRVLALLSLGDNWDSYGAIPVRRARAIDLLRLVEFIAQYSLPPPSIVPTPDGSLQIEWHTRGVDLEILCLGGMRYQVYFVNGQEAFESRKEFGPDMIWATEYFRLISYSHP